MIRDRSFAVCISAVIVAGCASTPQSHSLAFDAASKLQNARVVVVAPGASPVPSGARSDPGGDLVPLIPAPGLTPAQSVSPAGIIGGAVAVALISALVGADAEAQRKESIQLLSREGNIPNQDFARSVALREFKALTAKQTPLRVLDVDTAEAEAGTGQGHVSAALMQVVVRQTMSVDLSRLRIHLRAKLVGADGAELMDQNLFYFPVSVPGVTKEDALRSWREHDYRLYREHVEKGMAGAVDALDAVVFSRVQNDPRILPDAQALLKRTSCFGGDYDAGIPMSAYQAGRILPTRPGISAIQLLNGDILVFPQCEG